jgi:signal peptidase I
MSKIFSKDRLSDGVKFLLDIIVNLAVIVVLALIIRTYIVSPFHVFGPSMCDTLNYINDECVDTYGEFIIVNELGYQSFFGRSLSEPKVGDIVIFKPPNDDKGQYFVKRVIGVPGDRIKIEEGLVYKWEDGSFEEFDESAYLNKTNLGRTMLPNNASKTYEVPDGSYFVMGDNRARSTDSRHCFGKVSTTVCSGSNENAFVSMDEVRGKAWVVFWPFNKIRVLH